MSNLYPKIRVIFGMAEGCPWCDRLKTRTLPMFKSLSIRYQIVTNEDHLEAYGANEHGYPLIVIADAKGYPLKAHGGYLTLPELMALIDEVYTDKFPGASPNEKDV